MLNLSTCRLKSGCAALTVCVLAAVVAPIAMSSSAQAQDWIINDEPSLYDEQGDYSWFTPPANINSRGYGSNGFRFTIAIGNDARHDADSWANWDMGNVNGRYEIQVWIPDAWATANAGYEIWEDSSRIDTVWLNQQDTNGWQTLGTYNLGGHLRVSVYDTVTRDDYRTVGIANARLAVDALRIRRVSGDSQSPPPPPPSTAPGPPRNLRFAMTDADSFQISWNPPSDDGGSPITDYGVAVQNVGSGDIAGWFTTATSTSFDGVVGATYTVEVWARNSQGSGSAQRAQITVPSTGDVPGPPRNLTLTRTGSDGVRIRWAPPADDGGSRIIRYSISTWSPDGSTNSWTTTSTEYDFRGEVGTHYTVTVVAENRHGPSIPVRESIYLESDTPPARTLDRQVTISLGANNSGSNYCPYSQLACRWANITLTNFPAGTYLTRCVWWHSESSSERIPISGNISHEGSTSADVNRLCSFNVREGRSVYVTIDGIRSNTIRFPARGSGSAQPPASSQDGDLPPAMDEERDQEQARRPGPPRNLRLTLIDDDSFRITWDPLSSNGGSPITGYTLEVSRPRLSASVGPWSDTYTPRSTSFTFNGRKGATYTVRLAARNRGGVGRSVSSGITTTEVSPPEREAPSQEDTSPVSSGVETPGWIRITDISHDERTFQSDPVTVSWESDENATHYELAWWIGRTRSENPADEVGWATVSAIQRASELVCCERYGRVHKVEVPPGAIEQIVAEINGEHPRPPTSYTIQGPKDGIEYDKWILGKLLFTVRAINERNTARPGGQWSDGEPPPRRDSRPIEQRPASGGRGLPAAECKLGRVQPSDIITVLSLSKIIPIPGESVVGATLDAIWRTIQDCGSFWENARDVILETLYLDKLVESLARLECQGLFGLGGQTVDITGLRMTGRDGEYRPYIQCGKLWP